MFKDGKIMTLSFLIIFMLIPFTEDLIHPWILAAIVSAAGLVTGLAVGGRKTVFARMRYHQEYVMLVAAALSFGMAAFCVSEAPAGEYKGEVFIYLGITALLYYVMRGQETVRLAYFDTVFVVGSMLLLFYFVSYAIAPGMLLVPECVLYNKSLTGGMAVVNGMIAVWGFCRAKECAKQVMYCAGGIVSLLVVACNREPGITLILFAGIYAFILVVPPGEEYLKRCLSVFCGAVLILCNLSLLVNYTDFIKAEGLHYSLEGSVVGELLFSFFALYVMSIWDRLKEQGSLNKNGLAGLQGRLRRLVRLMGRVLIIFMIFGGIHLWVGLDNFMFLFWGEKWDAMQKGVVAAALVEWVVRMSEMLSGFWNGNVLALCYSAGGAAGLLLGGTVLGWIFRRIWTTVRGQKNIRLVFVVCGVILALMLFAPVALQMLPFYAVWIYILICGLQPAAVKKKTKRTGKECGGEAERPENAAVPDADSVTN